MKPTFTRREFLKLGSAALLSLGQAALSHTRAYAGPSDYEEFDHPPKPLGRIISWSAQGVYTSPTIQARRVAWKNHDEVIPLHASLTGEAPWPSNPVWYQTAGGFIHSGYVQPVENAIQSKIATVVRKPGIWAEVCVPYVEAHWDPNSSGVMRRLYYGTVYRVVNAVKDDLGEWWYQLQEGLTWNAGGPYVPARAMRYLSPVDLAPVSPRRQDKWIEINLQEQSLICFEDDIPVFKTRVASGVWDTATPRGEFTVLYKRHTQRMIGDDYDLAGVAFPVYITQSGVAIHGTYWHNDYGRPHSHGCLNVTSDAARWVFRWVDPTIPYTQHTQLAKTQQGTRVVVV